MTKWRIAAISSQVALVLYWEITEYIDLFPWNDVATLNIHTQIRDSLVNDLPKLLFIYAFIKGIRWLMGLSIAFYALWLAAILNQWLIPYLFGLAPLGRGISAEQHMQQYERLFSRTYKFLPAIDNHPIPDAQHVTLAVLSLITLIFVTVAFFKDGKSINALDSARGVGGWR
jgi:hypothetical protein